MKKIFILTILISVIYSLQTFAAEKSIILFKKDLTAKRKVLQHIPLFTATQGDIITVNVTVNEKRKDIILLINQHPGQSKICQHIDLRNLTHQFEVPSDAVYEISYIGPNADFSIEVLRTPASPKTRDFSRNFTYIRQPDTLHHSTYFDRLVGKNTLYTPKVKKVKVREVTSSEVIYDNSFALEGSTDLFFTKVPGDKIDKYKEQKLVSWSVMLSVGDEVHKALSNKVAEGLTAGFGSAIGALTNKATGSKKKKTEKEAQDYLNGYDFVDDIKVEKNKFDNSSEVLELSGQGLAVLYEGTAHEDEAKIAGKALESAAFIVSGGGIKGVAVDFAASKIEDLVGVELPSISGVASDIAGVITPKVKDKVHLKVRDCNDLETDLINTTSGFFTKKFNVDRFYQDTQIENSIHDRVLALYLESDRASIDARDILTDYVYGNLKVEATYKVTEYRDVIKYDKTEKSINTRDFRTWYDVNETFKIVFSDQVRPYFTEISELDYFSKRHRKY